MSGRKALTRCANCGNLREPAAMLRDRRTGEFHCVECDGAEYLAWRRSRRLGRATTRCIGHTVGGEARPCGSPGLPLERDGRCIRCQRLHRAPALAKADPFVSINDASLEWAPRDLPAPTTPRRKRGRPPLVGRWHHVWPACLRCGRITKKHNHHGLCQGCSSTSTSRRTRDSGVAVVWLPFAPGDPGRYDRSRAVVWFTAIDHEEAWRYLAARWAAQPWTPAGGKAVLRATARIDQLPEAVIRRAAA